MAKKVEEKKTLDQVRRENSELETQLTKRNEQFIFSLNKALEAAGYNDEKLADLHAEILPQLIDGQKTGTTARQLFGTASDYAISLVDAPKKPQEAKTWMSIVDASLMFFMMLALVYGVLGLFSKKSTQQPMGLVSLIINAIFVAIGVVYLTKFIGTRSQPRQQPIWKTIGLFIMFMLIFILVFMLTALLPGAINPVLPAMGYVVAGALAFGARLLFKSRFNFKSSVF